MLRRDEMEKQVDVLKEQDGSLANKIDELRREVVVKSRDRSKLFTAKEKLTEEGKKKLHRLQERLSEIKALVDQVILFLT